MPSGNPTVEIVTRRTPMLSESGPVTAANAGIRPFDVQQRFAHAHHDDIAEPFLRLEQSLKL